ncbi:MAG: bi-domain-containing oxidoreductase, partial [Candidatus Aminicenantales bacterium]
DIDERQIRAAQDSSVTLAASRNQIGLEKTVSDFTSGLGVDAVIITAGSSSTDPVDLAGALCRPKGKVVIVGAVPTGFSRASYYKKELDLRMSCSYGPGRYDPVYEEKGVDYPAGYVRWTENRNMQAFLELLEMKSVAVEDIITHTFPLENAPDAYQMILDKSEHYLGVLIEYDHSPSAVRPARSITFKESGPFASNEPAIGFIGTGNFAQNILLPRIHGSARLVGLSEAMGHVARKVATKYGFEFCTDSPDELIRDPRVNTIFIVTRHNLHAPYVIQALQAGKNVYVEKPIALSEPELEDVRRAYEASSGNARLMVGFNRRFAPFVRKTAALLTPAAPKAIQFRINAGAIPPGGWVNDPEVGGGRIVGEVCHFVDLAAFLAGGRVEAVQAWSMKDSSQGDNTLAAVLRFVNGSIAGLSYFSNGSSLLSKERLEVFFGGTSVVIDDFRTLTVYGVKTTSEKSKSQDKGHTGEIKAFLESIRTGAPSPISFPDLFQSMRATFKIVESLRSNRSVFLEETVESPAGPPALA